MSSSSERYYRRIVAEKKNFFRIAAKMLSLQNVFWNNDKDNIFRNWDLRAWTHTQLLLTAKNKLKSISKALYVSLSTYLICFLLRGKPDGRETSVLIL